MTVNFDRSQKLKDFVAELAGFAADAERALKRIEADPHGNKGEFTHFSEMMLAIEKGSQIKKCVAALWDALTTLKYMLENIASPKSPDSSGDANDSTEEQEILKNRLQATLRSLGGARETVSADDIEALLRGGK